MNVWIATWDVRNAGSGVEVFASKKLAVEAAVDFANEMSLLGPGTLTEKLARKHLMLTGSLEFECEECFYGVEEHEVQGYEA